MNRLMMMIIGDTRLMDGEPGNDGLPPAATTTATPPSDTTTTTTQNEDDGSLVTVITYRYDYDDFTFYIEADVQAIQTHNAPDALKSMWGVNNVSAGNGTLTVN